MFLLINCNYDGDSYSIFDKIETAMEAFNESCEEESNHRVYLVKPEIGETFGFGSRGEIFGAEIIEEYDEDDD
jgi:hypothetical protein